FACDASGESDSNQLPLAIDLHVGDRYGLGDKVIGGRVRERFGLVPAGYEDRRAEDLRHPGDRPAVGVVGRESGLGVEGPGRQEADNRERPGDEFAVDTRLSVRAHEGRTFTYRRSV